MDKKDFDPNGLRNYDNNHWDGVDKTMLKLTLWWVVGWGSLAVGLLLWHWL